MGEHTGGTGRAGRRDAAGSKARLRTAARRRRRALPEDYRALADAAIREAVGDLVANEGVRSVGLYAALPGEIDLDPLAVAWLAAGIEVAYPRVLGVGGMRFHRVAAVPHVFRGAPPIREPDADLPVARPALVIVPGLAYDVTGARLGYGGGFFDRWLAANTGVLAVGVCRRREMVEAVPVAVHDVRVDAVVCEDAVYR